MLINVTKQPCLKVLIIFILGIILGRYFCLPFSVVFLFLVVSFILSFFFNIFLALTILTSGFILTLNGSASLERFAAFFSASISFKKYIQSLYFYYLPNMEASLISGIVLGGGQNIPKEVQQMFRDTGTVHILAVSGLNVGLIGAVCFLIIVNILRLPKKIAVVPSILMVWFYALTTGLNPPVVRSAITLTVIFLGYVIEREGDVLNSLALAALIILLFNPLTLFSISFQLSFVCVLSMILICPELDSLLRGNDEKINGNDTKSAKRISNIKTLFLLSLAIQIGIWPITAFYFQQVSLISVIANIFVVPLVSIILYLGITMIIFSKVIFLTRIFANAGWFCLIILERIVLFFSKLPYANFHIKSPGLGFVLCYYVILTVVLVIRTKLIGEGSCMKKKLELPKFKNEDMEREFWNKIDLSEHFEPGDFQKVSFPNLKPTSRSISIRIPEYVLNRLKEKANEINIPYQSLLKGYIKKGLLN